MVDVRAAHDTPTDDTSLHSAPGLNAVDAATLRTVACTVLIASYLRARWMSAAPGADGDALLQPVTYEEGAMDARRIARVLRSAPRLSGSWWERCACALHGWFDHTHPPVYTPRPCQLSVLRWNVDVLRQNDDADKSDGEYSMHMMYELLADVALESFDRAMHLRGVLERTSDQYEVLFNSTVPAHRTIRNSLEAALEAMRTAVDELAPVPVLCPVYGKEHGSQAMLIARSGQTFVLLDVLVLDKQYLSKRRALEDA